MRYLIFIISVFVILNGCKNNSNSVALTSGQTVVITRAVKDSIQYTFATSKAIFGVHDTLNATVIAFNQSVRVDTVLVGLGPRWFGWSLVNESGKSVMASSVISDNSIIIEPLNPHQSIEIYGIHQVIADSSGAPLPAGSYTLQAFLYSQFLFLLKLTLQ